MKSLRTQNITEFVDEIERSSGIYSDSINAGKELDWRCHRILITKTNHHGDIEYANEPFLLATGYEAHELINKPHRIVKHPDIPKTVYECMKISLIERGVFACFMKIKTKDDNYFWAEEHCELREGADGPLIYMKRYFVKHEIVQKEIEPLYANLREIENSYGIQKGLDYLKAYLEAFASENCEQLVSNIKLKYSSAT